MPTLMVEGLGSEVLPQPYQQEATPTPRFRARIAGVEGFRIGQRARPMRLQRLEAFDDADAGFQPLAGNRFGAVREAQFFRRKSSRSMPSLSASSS